MAAPILLAFNGQLDIANSYQWMATDIMTFLDQVVANPAHFGVDNFTYPDPVQLARIQADLPIIAAEIRRLSTFPPTEGRTFWYFKRPPPKQHIRRRLVPNQATTAPLPIGHDGFLYYNHYDLLGLFLSYLGNAPPGANRANFFLPLLAMFGRWCVMLGSNNFGATPTAPNALPGVGDPPAIFQCTWRQRFAGPIRFHLGASMAGFERDERSALLTGWWEKVAKARYDLVNADQTITNMGFSFLWSATRRPNNPAGGVRFGNCAETYPFLKLLWGQAADPHVIVSGLALKREFLGATRDPSRVLPYNPSTGDGGIWRKTLDPCGNCQALIVAKGGSRANFDYLNGSAGAPA